MLTDYDRDKNEWLILREACLREGRGPERVPATMQNMALLVAGGSRFTDRALAHLAEIEVRYEVTDEETTVRALLLAILRSPLRFVRGVAQGVVAWRAGR